MSTTGDRDAAHNRETIVKLGALLSDVFTGVAQEAQRSIVEGSELTGSPGQPVDTQKLQGSWQLVYDSPNVAVIGTNVEYAESIEDGQQAPYTKKNGTHVTPGPITFRSAVGGAHSVKLTVAGMDRIVDAVKSRVMKGGQ